VEELESLPRRHVHELRVNIFNQFGLDGLLDVTEDPMVFHGVQLATELLQRRLASHCAKLAVFEVGLSDVLGYDRAVGLAEIAVGAWSRASE